jgi:hypothetical protein
MAILNTQNGMLLYILLNSETPSKDGRYFQEYHVTMSPTEKQLILDKLDKDILELQRRFESRDPSRVRHIYDDKEYRSRTGRNWMCEDYCPYKEKCAIMRNQLPLLKPQVAA